MFNFWIKRKKPPIDHINKNSFYWVLGYTGIDELPFEICRWDGISWINNYGDNLGLNVEKWKRLKA